MIKTIAYFPRDAEYLGNKVFDIQHRTNVTYNLDRWVALRDFLEKKGIALNTYDQYKNWKEVDVFLCTDPGRQAFTFILRNFLVLPRRRILGLTEPPLINSLGWRYLGFYSWLFKIILSWNPELTRQGGKYLPWHYPINFVADKYQEYKTNQKKNLCLMIHSNKTTKQRGELYSLRRQLITYFTNRGDRLLDLYGYGWNDENHEQPFFSSLYQGTTADKKETYSQYYFVFCIDNSIVPGYITYDPFIAMSTGAVPIYLPMPDTDTHIPAETYINFSDFEADWAGLVLRLEEIVKSGEYERYQERAEAYLHSKQFQTFTIPQFCEDVYQAILRA